MKRRLSLFLAFAVVLATAATGSGGTSLARFTAASSSGGSIDADVLAPPTGLAASGAASVATLTWTPTVDTYAAGYQVLRSSTSGSGHTVIATVTPRAATTTTDTPGTGTWYYLLRSTYEGWTSLPSNQASVTFAASTSTAFVPCVSNAADTSGAGDNNGYEGNPARACTSDNSYATDANSGTTGSTPSCGSGSTPSSTEDRHRFWGFAHGVTSASAINGIEVRLDLALNNNSGTDNICVQLSWNGGSSWTTIQGQEANSVPEQTYLFGGPTDTWGRTWTLTQLNTTNFRVRVIDAAQNTNKQFRLDYLAVKVHYTP